MFSAWGFEDFKPQLFGRGDARDYWEPALEGIISLVTPAHAKMLPAFGDFWDPFPKIVDQANSTDQNLDDWSRDLELPLFVARAAENPFHLRPRASLSESLVMRRARWLLSLLDVPGMSDRRRLLAHFVEIFDLYTHASTFRALTDLALNDSTGEEIATAFQLKMLWSEHPKLWTIRRGKATGPITPHNGRSALTWTRAILLVKHSNGLPPECIIDNDWFEDWLQLPFGDPAYWSFLDYATLRREAFSSGVLDLPLELQRRDERGLPSPSFGGNAIDGSPLGSTSRTGQLVRLTSDAWALSCFIPKEATRP